MESILEIGDHAPDFSLVGTDGLIYGINQFKGYRATVLFFTSNTSLYARGSDEYHRSLYAQFRKKGVAFLAINPCGDENNSFEEMCKLCEELKVPWPYLQDPMHQIATRYGATVVPQYFLFDHQRILVYKGRALDNPKNPDESFEESLKNSLEELLDSRPISVNETTPIGTLIQGEICVRTEELLFV